MARNRVFVACYAASGAAALVYQVVWVRMFTLVLGHTVAASSTVLAAFMGGLALGAWATGRFPAARIAKPADLCRVRALDCRHRRRDCQRSLSAFEPLLAAAYADGTAPTRFAIVRVAVSLVLLGIPAAAMGATYPIAVSWLAHSEDLRNTGDRLRASTDGGVLYTVNTAGAAAGAVAAGFWLIPSLGIRGTTWIAVALNIAAAGGALWLGRADPPVHVGPSTLPRRRRGYRCPERSTRRARRLRPSLPRCRDLLPWCTKSRGRVCSR